jgi:hypothetical protein
MDSTWTPHGLQLVIVFQGIPKFPLLYTALTFLQEWPILAEHYNIYEIKFITFVFKLVHGR